MESDIKSSAAPSEEVLEPMTGKGLPSYRPWDWIAGYAIGAVIMGLMFYFAKSYHL